jgi:hypothetical protein
MYHFLKTDKTEFEAVYSGVKTFEIRKDDRNPGYFVGDVLCLKETEKTGQEMQDGAALEYTGRKCKRIISHIMKGEVWGLKSGWVIISFKGWVV